MNDDKSATPLRDEAENAQGAAKAVRLLANAFHRMPPVRGSVGSDDDYRFLGFGWWARCVRLAELIVLACESGFHTETAPLSRSLIEHTMALQWVLESGESALIATLRAEQDHVGALLTSLDKAKWILPPLDGARRKLDVTLPITDEEGYLGNFEQLCAEYGLRTYYPVYRTLSAEDHATAPSARRYVRQEGSRYVLDPRPRPVGHAALIDAAVCLLRAAKVIQAAVGNRQLDDAIRQAVEVLGTDIQLPSRAKRAQRGRGSDPAEVIDEATMTRNALIASADAEAPISLLAGLEAGQLDGVESDVLAQVVQRLRRARGRVSSAEGVIGPLLRITSRRHPGKSS